MSIRRSHKFPTMTSTPVTFSSSPPSPLRLRSQKMCPRWMAPVNRLRKANGLSGWLWVFSTVIITRPVAVWLNVARWLQSKLPRALLVLGGATIFGQANHLGMWPATHIPSWIGTVSTSKSWGINGHPMQCSSLLSVVLQHKLVSGWGLRKWRSALRMGPCMAQEGLNGFYMWEWNRMVICSCEWK